MHVPPLHGADESRTSSHRKPDCDKLRACRWRFQPVATALCLRTSAVPPRASRTEISFSYRSEVSWRGNTDNAPPARALAGLSRSEGGNGPSSAMGWVDTALPKRADVNFRLSCTRKDEYMRLVVPRANRSPRSLPERQAAGPRKPACDVVRTGSSIRPFDTFPPRVRP